MTTIIQVNPLEEKILQFQAMCQVRHWTLGLAESCTGGLLSSWITQVSGVSNFFRGAVVSYDRRVKNRILGVPFSTMQVLGEVSEVVAYKMAQGARLALQCDLALAMTGIAGPGGGSKEKPVGTVCFAVVGPGFEQKVTRYFSDQLSRQEIQKEAAVFAFDLVFNHVKENTK